jgi:IS1 family transposase
VHHALVEQGGLDLVQVQADEIRVKGHKLIAWMGLAMMVSTRLWLGGMVSATRDRMLADRLMGQVRACAQHLCALLVCTDGWAAYPGSIKRAFRKTGQDDGRTRASELAGLAGVAHRHGHQTHGQPPSDPHHAADGSWDTGAGDGPAAYLARGTVLNTAFIERFNGTMRERLAALTRKCRHAAHRLAALHTGMYLLGCTYNFCWPHHELSRCAPDAHTGKQSWEARTPAMASGLTDHVWSVFELMSYRIAPPAGLPPNDADAHARSLYPTRRLPNVRVAVRKIAMGTSTS